MRMPTPGIVLVLVLVRRFCLRLCLSLGLGAGLGCTDVSLYGKVGQEPPLADKLGLTGVLCTDNPATRKFPVKILFIVDSSGVMSEAAPQAEHVSAIETTLSQYLPIANVEIGIIKYGTISEQLISEQRGRVTSGFSRDDALIDAALVALRTGAGARDLVSAMSMARSIVTGDAFLADKGPLSRTKYVVVHIMSGGPQPRVEALRCAGYAPVPANCELAFMEHQVEDIRNTVLDLGAAEFVFHTIHLEQAHVEGSPCDPGASPGTCGPGLVCIQVGARADSGRCAELCDPAASTCGVLNPSNQYCSTTTLPGGTTLNFCGRRELDCFDGVDNDDDGRDMDCSDPNYPYNCTASSPTGCDPDCAGACRAERVGLAMSLVTGGRYERFAFPDQLNMGRIDFRSTQRLFVLKEFLAFNRNALPAEDGFVPDSDGDGLSDLEESRLCEDDPMNPGTQICLNPDDADTDGDYFNDRLEHMLRTLGMDPLVPTTVADCDDPTIDTDGDGLRDCEEKLLGSDGTLFDTDADGFPDQVEFRLGTNMLFNDNLDDLDFDGVNNGSEVRAHTDPLFNDSIARSELAYRYRTIDLGQTNDERTCYDFRISNITLVDTRDRGAGPGFNDIDVFFGQVPEGSLEGFGVFHVSQVRIQYLPPDRRVPSTPSIDLEDDDFAVFEQ